MANITNSNSNALVSGTSGDDTIANTGEGATILALGGKLATS